VEGYLRRRSVDKTISSSLWICFGKEAHPQIGNVSFTLLLELKAGPFLALPYFFNQIGSVK
jgi:hypothetical protein